MQYILPETSPRSGRRLREPPADSFGPAAGCMRSRAPAMWRARHGRCYRPQDDSNGHERRLNNSGHIVYTRAGHGTYRFFARRSRRPTDLSIFAGHTRTLECGTPHWRCPGRTRRPPGTRDLSRPRQTLWRRICDLHGTMRARNAIKRPRSRTHGEYGPCLPSQT